MIVRYHQDAIEEYDRAVKYYSAFNPHLAARLIEEVERCVERIQLHPFQGSELRPNIRSIHTRVFAYHLVYMLQDDVITILAVAHDKRDPEYWTGRVN